MTKSVYEIITNKIIEKLEQGVIPWRRPWTNSNAVNWKTQKPYRGINCFLVEPGEIYQLGALDGFLKISGVSMSHVKLHGALYMMACEVKEISMETIKAVKDYNPKLEIYTLPNSELTKQAKLEGLDVINEFFADRPYDSNSIKMFDWSMDEIGSLDDIANNVLKTLEQRQIEKNEIDTICVHSDTPGAPAIIKAIRKILTEAGWIIGRSSD